MSINITHVVPLTESSTCPFWKHALLETLHYYDVLRISVDSRVEEDSDQLHVLAEQQRVLVTPASARVALTQDQLDALRPGRYALDFGASTRGAQPFAFVGTCKDAKAFVRDVRSGACTQEVQGMLPLADDMTPLLPELGRHEILFVAPSAAGDMSDNMASCLQWYKDRGYNVLQRNKLQGNGLRAVLNKMKCRTVVFVFPNAAWLSRKMLALDDDTRVIVLVDNARLLDGQGSAWVARADLTVVSSLPPRQGAALMLPRWWHRPREVLDVATYWTRQAEAGPKLFASCMLRLGYLTWSDAPHAAEECPSELATCAGASKHDGDVAGSSSPTSGPE